MKTDTDASDSMDHKEPARPFKQPASQSFRQSASQSFRQPASQSFRQPASQPSKDPYSNPYSDPYSDPYGDPYGEPASEPASQPRRPFGSRTKGKQGAEPREEKSRPKKRNTKPLSEPERREIRKTLFTRQDPLAPKEVLKKLAMIEEDYEAMAENLISELDPEILIEYHENIDEYCEEPGFYADMLVAQREIMARHKALSKYISKCIDKYQTVCNAQMKIIGMLNDFIEAHEEGWSHLEIIDRKVEALKPLNAFTESQMMSQAFQEFLGEQRLDYMHLVRFRDTMTNLCKDIGDLAGKLRIDHFKKVWDYDGDIALFLRNVNICRHLDLSAISAKFQGNYNQIFWPS